MHCDATGRDTEVRLRRHVHRLMAELKAGDRAEEYEALLRQALDAGYRLIRLQDFVASLSGEAAPLTGRTLVLRHDVDVSNVAGNRMLFRIESALGARSSYFFRLSTAPAHSRFIGELLEAGFEVGYHFEEAATIAKEHRLRRREDVLARRDEIAERFITECARIRATWAPGLTSAASHGHWLNRRLEITNHELIDTATLDAAGIDYEAYEARIMDAAAVYVSDVAVAPQRWARGISLGSVLDAKISPIYLLTHEVRWHSRPQANLRNIAERIEEGIAYRVPVTGPARRTIRRGARSR